MIRWNIKGNRNGFWKTGQMVTSGIRKISFPDPILKIWLTCLVAFFINHIFSIKHKIVILISFLKICPNLLWNKQYWYSLAAISHEFVHYAILFLFCSCFSSLENGGDAGDWTQGFCLQQYPLHSFCGLFRNRVSLNRYIIRLG